MQGIDSQKFAPFGPHVILSKLAVVPTQLKCSFFSFNKRSFTIIHALALCWSFIRALALC
jgi:hypothetical protein